MKIRAATLHDAPALTALMRALAAEHPDHWRWQPGLSWPVHIAEVGGTVVGWVASVGRARHRDGEGGQYR